MSSYELTEYDLTNKDQVVKLGGELGNEWGTELMPLIKALGMEERIVFFPALLGNITGQMCASIGEEATHAVLDTMKMLSQGMEQRRKDRQQ